MRKLLLLSIASMLLIFTSCDKEENLGMDSPAQQGSEKLHFYGVKKAPTTKGVAQRDNLWVNGTVITVKFLEDPFNLTEEIKNYVKEWEKYANITFKFVDSTEKALVRIGFNWNDEKYVTWSYTGSDSKHVINQAEATANFADFDLLSVDERKCEVLRLFGQVLGLDLEHRHLTANPDWRSIAKVEDYWTGNISDIPWAELTQYVFDPISEDNYVATDNYDASSIMVWPFPKTVLRYINGNVNSGTGNCELSETDKGFIAKLYPKDTINRVSEIRPLKGRCVHLHTRNNGFKEYSVDCDLYSLAWTWGGVKGEIQAILSFDLSELKSTNEIEKITMNLYSNVGDYALTTYRGRSNNGVNNAIYIQQISSPWDFSPKIWALEVKADNRIRIPHTDAPALDLQVDVTDMVKSMAADSSNHGFLFQMESLTPYSSRNFYGITHEGIDPSKVPTLNITYKE